MMLKHIITNNRCFRSSHYLNEEINKSYDPTNKLSDVKEFEMKEFNGKLNNKVIDYEKNQYNFQKEQQIFKNLKVCEEEEEEQRKMWEEDINFDKNLLKEESKKEENIKELNPSNDFSPLIVTHLENVIKKKNSTSKFLFIFL